MKHIEVGLIAGGLTLGVMVLFFAGYQIAGLPGLLAVGLAVGVTITVTIIDKVTEQEKE